jgi:hypothetical protein
MLQSNGESVAKYRLLYCKETVMPKKKHLHALAGGIRGLGRQFAQPRCHTCTKVLQGWYRGVPGVLQGWYRDVTRVLQACYKDVTRDGKCRPGRQFAQPRRHPIQGCYRNAYGCYKDVTRALWALQGCSKGLMGVKRIITFNPNFEQVTNIALLMQPQPRVQEPPTLNYPRLRSLGWITTGNRGYRSLVTLYQVQETVYVCVCVCVCVCM